MIEKLVSTSTENASNSVPQNITISENTRCQEPNREKILAEDFKVTPPGFDDDIVKLDPYVFLEQLNSYIKHKKLTERQVLDLVLSKWLKGDAYY